MAYQCVVSERLSYYAGFAGRGNFGDESNNQRVSSKLISNAAALESGGNPGVVSILSDKVSQVADWWLAPGVFDVSTKQSTHRLGMGITFLSTKLKLRILGSLMDGPQRRTLGNIFTDAVLLAAWCRMANRDDELLLRLLSLVLKNKSHFFHDEYWNTRVIEPVILDALCIEGSEPLDSCFQCVGRTLQSWECFRVNRLEDDLNNSYKPEYRDPPFNVIPIEIQFLLTSNYFGEEWMVDEGLESRWVWLENFPAPVDTPCEFSNELEIAENFIHNYINDLMG